MCLTCEIPIVAEGAVRGNHTATEALAGNGSIQPLAGVGSITAHQGSPARVPETSEGSFNAVFGFIVHGQSRQHASRPQERRIQRNEVRQHL